MNGGTYRLFGRNEIQMISLKNQLIASYFIDLLKINQNFYGILLFSFYQADQASEAHSDSPRVVSGNLRQLQQQLSQLQLQDSDHYQGKITYYEVIKVFNTLWGLICKFS